MSLFATIFAPGVQLMHRLPLRYKLWGIAAFVLIPIIWSGVDMVGGHFAKRESTVLERTGTEANRLIYRFLSQSLDRGETSDTIEALSVLVDAQAHPPLTAAWESFQAWSRAVESTEGPLSRRNSEGLMRAAWRMVVAEGNAFGLSFEPEQRESLNVDLVHERILNVISEAQRLHVEVNAVETDRNAVAAYQTALAAAIEESLVVSRAFDAAGGHIPDAVGEAIAAGRLVASTPSLQVTPVSVENLRSLIFDAHGELLDVLEAELLVRSDALSRILWIEVAAGVVMILVLFYAMLSMMRAMGESVRVLRTTIEAASDGDLRHSAVVPGRDVIASLGGTLDMMTEDLSVRVGKIRSEAVRVTMASCEIAKANRELMERTEQGSTSITQTTASVHSLDQTVSGSSRAAQEAVELVGQVRSVAEGSSETMSEAVKTMQALQVDASKMVEIIGAIDGIAFQTNILALNASVEAARAGEAGRGFAVVASEVRSLAQRCADSAQQVRDLIERSNSRVEMGVIGIDAVNHSLQEIVASVREANDKVTMIAETTALQNQSIQEISVAVTQLESISEQNAAMVDQTLQAAEALNQRSQGLSDAVQGMELRRGTADEAYDMVTKAKDLFDREGFAAARTAIHDQKGDFRDRDLYVFAFDRSRMFEIYGADPGKAGHTTVDDLPGLDGEHLFRAGWDAADRGGDWIEYNVRNPVSGKVEPKISYMVAVGDYAMGCGVYKPIPRHEREAAERAKREAREARMQEAKIAA